MTEEFLKQQVVSQMALTLFASQKNSKDWNPEQALDNGEEAYVIQYDRQSDVFSIYPFDENDTFALNDVFFENEEDAQEFIDKHLDILESLIGNIKSEEDVQELTLDVVATTALELIDANGYTTTLEVKKALRADGYEVTQEQVSNYMQDILHTEHLKVGATHTDGRNHLIFSK